jgi:hypothetical protein
MFPKVLMQNTADLIQFYNGMSSPLERGTNSRSTHVNPFIVSGLYIGVLQPLSTVASIYLRVYKSAPHCPPYLKLRDNAHVSKEEWQWLLQLNQPETTGASELQLELQQLIASASCWYSHFPFD